MIKYGCVKSSWATDIMYCPVLRWAGPTRQDLMEYHETRMFGEWAANQEADGEELDRRVRKEWAVVRQSMEKVLQKPCTKAEMNLYVTDFKRLGMLDDEDELWAEVELMKETGNVSNMDRWKTAAGTTMLT